jgi:hypothetical protein
MEGWAEPVEDDEVRRVKQMPESWAISERTIAGAVAAPPMPEGIEHISGLPMTSLDVRAAEA